MIVRRFARLLPALFVGLLAGACGHDWSTGDGSMDADSPRPDGEADVPDADDGSGDAPDSAPDAPPDAPPDVPPDDTFEVEPDVPPDSPDVADEADDDAPPDARPPLVDLVVLAENTGSFTTERTHLVATVATLLDALDAAALGWDLALGVAAFGDFPVGTYGTAGDVVFEVLQAVTASTDLAVTALGAIADRNGADMPDGAVVALYLLATGSALEPYFSRVADCPTGYGGAVCFRPGAARLVLLISDSPMHNGPPDGASDPYSASVLGLTMVPSWPAATAALISENIRVIGLNTGTAEVHADLEAVAVASGAETTTGPAAYDIDLDTGTVNLSFLVPVLEALVP